MLHHRRETSLCVKVVGEEERTVAPVVVVVLLPFPPFQTIRSTSIALPIRGVCLSRGHMCSHPLPPPLLVSLINKTWKNLLFLVLLLLHLY